MNSIFHTTLLQIVSHKLMLTILAAVAILTTSTTPVNASSIYEDNFDGNALDPSWGTVQTDPTGFLLPGVILAENNGVSGGTWNISDVTIQTDVTYGHVWISRDVSSLTGGDFQLDVDFVADGTAINQVGMISASLLDAGDNIVAGNAWYSNGAVNTNAVWQRNLGDVDDKLMVNFGGNGSATTAGLYGPNGPIDGHGRMRISRSGNMYTIEMGFLSETNFIAAGSDYDNIPFFAPLTGPGANGNAIQNLVLRFSELRLDSISSTTLPLGFDRVSLVAIPEPASFVLFGISAVGLIVVPRRRRRQ